MQVFDHPLLGAWVHRMRKVHKEGRLPAWQVAKLDELVFVWKMDQQGAKWHHNLHEARRFKVGAATRASVTPRASPRDMALPCYRLCSRSYVLQLLLPMHAALTRPMKILS